MALILASCATTTTQLAPVSREAVAAEEVAQREFVVSELNRARDRVLSINGVAVPPGEDAVASSSPGP